MKKHKLLFILLLILQAGVASAVGSDAQEKIDRIFGKGVEVLGSVLFWDPFASIGLYDPIVYQDGVPYINDTLPGMASGHAGSHLLQISTGVIKTASKGSQIVAGGHIYTVQKTIGGNILILDRKLDADLQNAAYGYPRLISMPLIVIWLVFAAVFFTLRFGFVNVRGFPRSWRVLRGDYTDPHKKIPGQITPFQALSTAVSGSVGLGNISSVAVAIAVGGPGATLWIVVAGFLGMSTKFVEATLGVKYREIDSKGRVYGGPMYYLKNAFKKRNLPRLGKILAAIYALFMLPASFAGGCMFQSNQVAAQLSELNPAFAGYEFVVGLVMAALVGVVIIGGIRSIARVTSQVVPAMGSLYVLTAMFVIMVNYDNILPSFMTIFESAFSPGAVRGGVLGVLILGFQRASFSNEAGFGSCAVAHSAVKNEHPVSEGFVAMIEPFIDTILICTMTSLVIVISGEYGMEGVSGVQLTSRAFGSVIGWFPNVLAIIIFLFGFSTAVSWSYYGMKAWTYFLPHTRLTENIFKAMFVSAVAFGAVLSLDTVLNFTDMIMLSMAFPNVLGLIVFSGEVRRDLIAYLRGIQSGSIVNFREQRKGGTP